MEMGTGKTRIAIELIHSTNADLVLFVCPFSTKHTLQSEIKKWGLQTDYIILGYETLSSSDKIYLETLEQLKNKNLFIVADESIFIKNEETKRFNRVMEMARNSQYRLILNGTPITKNEWDLYNQMEFLSSKILGMSRGEFLNTFFTKVKYKKKFDRPKEFYKLSQVNIDYLYKLIEPYIFRIEFNFDKVERTEYGHIISSDKTKEDYKKLKEKLIDNLKNDKPIFDILRFMQHLIFTGEERCQQIADQLNGQCIVYCSFIKEVKNIAKQTDCYIITGDTNDREQIINDFKNDNKPLIMTYGVGSYGLNLQFCNHIIFSSITFDYGKVEQAQARIKRIGQERDVTYTYMESEFGLYNMIENNLANKKGIHDLIFSKMKEGVEWWQKNI